MRNYHPSKTISAIIKVILKEIWVNSSGELIYISISLFVFSFIEVEAKLLKQFYEWKEYLIAIRKLSNQLAVYI